MIMDILLNLFTKIKDLVFIFRQRNYTIFRVAECAGFCPDSLFGRRCAHYKQEQCVSLFPRPGNHMSGNKTQYI
jgi:hypothetical protein